MRNIELDKIQEVLQRKAAKDLGFICLADAFQVLHLPKRVAWRVLFLLHETGGIRLRAQGRSAGITILETPAVRHG